jgi:hypothetical protein
MNEGDELEISLWDKKDMNKINKLLKINDKLLARALLSAERIKQNANGKGRLKNSLKKNRQKK